MVLYNKFYMALCAAAASASVAGAAETQESIAINAQGDESDAFNWHRDERLQGANDARKTTTKEFYEMQELPMFTEFLANCYNDIRQNCNPNTNTEGYMNQWWSCLERSDFSKLTPKCKQYIKFGFDGVNPNPAFFEKVFDCKDMPASAFKVPMDTNCYIGYLKAPLFSGMPAASPITQTWYLVIPATTQPAPKGLLVQHNGGPAPGIAGDNILMSKAQAQTQSRVFGFPDKATYINENYDVVFTDLRGMGLSSLRYKMQMDPAKLSAASFFITYMYAKEQDLQIGSDTSYSASNVKMAWDMYENGTVKEVIYASSRCAGQEYPKGPSDWTSMSEVRKFTEAHAEYLTTCGAKYTMEDGLGGSYLPWQYWGTSAAASDLESLRQAFGSPEISLMGYSYGTRYVAAYVSSFPQRIARAVVSGTVNPSPDAKVVADYTAQNTQNIFDYIAGLCELSDDCDADMYAAAKTAYDMTLNNGAGLDGGPGFKNECCATVSQATISEMYRPMLVGEAVPGFNYPGGQYTNGYPTNFAILPWAVDYFKGSNVCMYAAHDIFPSFDLDPPNTMMLIPSLDMVGRVNAYVLAQNLVAVSTKDPIGLHMAMQYMQSTFGWPVEPTPIGFASRNVKMLIANTLYDERTSVENAYMYRTNFVDSKVITAQAGGHCISASNSPECNGIMGDFLVGLSEPEDGYTCKNRLNVNFTMGKSIWLASDMYATISKHELPKCVDKKCTTFKTRATCNKARLNTRTCKWNNRLKRCINQK